jgi:L-lactate dehydrogenase (cytochrome)/(S)-mandelate dehydrogenase
MREATPMSLDTIVNIDDLRHVARRRLPRIAFDFIEGGVEGESGLARNEDAFRRYRLLPRYLVDVSSRDQTTTLFGRTYDSPFGICPTGAAGLWRTGADDMLAQAAKAANIPFLMSCSSTGSIESAVRHAPGNMWFQLYGSRDRAISRQMIERVRDLGVETLVITVDVPVSPRRERNMRNGFARPLRLRLSTILDGLRRPSWLAGYLRAGGGMPRMENWAPYAKPGATPDDVADVYAAQTPSADHTWHDIEQYRRMWPGKLVLKGILHPEDAVRAVAIGTDGIIVSNHGGRQLDLAPSPLEVLPAIREAVGPDQTLMIDSGVRRGTDILVARCLGAQFAFVGRATLYGVAAYGLPGAHKAIDILRREIDINLAQLGCTSLAALGPHTVMRPPDAYQITGNPTVAWHAANRPAASAAASRMSQHAD